MKEWHGISTEEMLEHARQQKAIPKITRPGDLGVRMGLLLLLPYVVWLSRYNEKYVSTIHGKIVHFNFDGVILSIHKVLNSANIIVHEAGHGICHLLPCPQFLSALNGTLFQLLLPMIFSYYYFKRKNSVLGTLGFTWLGQNLVYVSWYMSTSHMPKKYPSFIPGADIHDFWYIFSQMGVLEYDWLFSGIVRTLAIMMLWGSYGYLLYIAFIKSETKQAKRFRKEDNE